MGRLPLKGSITDVRRRKPKGLPEYHIDSVSQHHCKFNLNSNFSSKEFKLKFHMRFGTLTILPSSRGCVLDGEGRSPDPSSCEIQETLILNLRNFQQFKPKNLNQESKKQETTK